MPKGKSPRTLLALFQPRLSADPGGNRSLRRGAARPIASKKSDSAKDAQIVRFKECIRKLEEQVRALQEENEPVYGKLINCKSV
jgi:hypothetical protein